MILLDTNVISESIRPAPNPAVENWLSGHVSSNLFISVITETELRYGIALLPESRRRILLSRAVDCMLKEDFAGRILHYDRKAAAACALIRAKRQKSGRPIGYADAQIAGIAHSRRALLATRNSKDFVDCGIEIVNPWIR